MGMYRCSKCENHFDNDYHPCEEHPTNQLLLICPSCAEDSDNDINLVELPKCDGYFVFIATQASNPSNQLRLTCGVEWDYATDTGSTACLVFAMHEGFDVKALIDPELIAEIEDHSIENMYAIEQSMTESTLSMEIH